jgi:hypothetical protein
MTHREQIEAWSHDRHPHDRLLLDDSPRAVIARHGWARVLAGGLVGAVVLLAISGWL